MRRLAQDDTFCRRVDAVGHIFLFLCFSLLYSFTFLSHLSLVYTVVLLGGLFVCYIRVLRVWEGVRRTVVQVVPHTVAKIGV